MTKGLYGGNTRHTKDEMKFGNPGFASSNMSREFVSRPIASFRVLNALSRQMLTQISFKLPNNAATLDAELIASRHPMRPKIE